MEYLSVTEKENDSFILGGETLHSRLLLGTGKYCSLPEMKKAMQASGAAMITVALRRLETAALEAGREGSLLDYIPSFHQEAEGQGYEVERLPNTSGARTATEAVLAAQMARELFQTDFIKLEIHPDPAHLMPDPIETLKATEMLVKEGFIVLPYIHADPVLCKRLEAAGAAAVMPLGSPIGSNMGLQTKTFLEMIIAASTVPVIVDAGIGRPSDAALAMELGADAVLVSTAIATAMDPIQMALAFRQAVTAGRHAYLAGLGGQGLIGDATSPLTEFLL